MKNLSDHPLIGTWRITEMELWDGAFIDLLGPGYIRFDPDGRGEFVFGAVQGGLDCHYGPASIHFTWPDTTRWTRPPVMATPNARTTGHSPARSDSTSATNPPSPLGAGRFSAPC